MTSSLYTRVFHSFWLCLFFTQGFGQSFYNLDFEYSKPSGYPHVWQTNEGNSNSSIKITSSASYKGKQSLQLDLNNSPMSLAGLLFPNSLLKGKSIEISGHIKTDSLQKGTVQLFYYDYGKRALVFSEETVSGSTPWKLCTFRFDIDSNSKGEGIIIGIKANGTGKVLFDNAQIHIGSQILQDKGFPYKELTTAEQATLSRMSIPIPAFLDNSLLKESNRLKSIIGNSTIVGLGENSHGSGSIFKLKNELIKYLVKEMQFTVLAMEAPAPEVDRINLYIQGKKGDLNDVIKHLGFKSWQTKEVLELIQWLKEYNQTYNTKIQFKGFDIQSKEVAIENLRAFSKSHNYEKITSLIDSTIYLLSGNRISDSTRKMALKKVDSIKAQLDSLLRIKSLAELRDSLTYLRHNAEILTQNIGLPLLKNRREAMARNIQWIKENSPSGTKIIIWAHNDHVSKLVESMGSYLWRWYGQQYLAVGATFFGGSYAAYGSQNYYTAEPAYLGTYEYYFSKAKPKQYMINLRELKQQKHSNWVKQSLDFRNLGAESQTNQFRPINVFESFDVLIYLDKSTHAIYLAP